MHTKTSMSSNLPIHSARSTLVKALQLYQIVLLKGETGSGKTTQVPQFLLEMQYPSKIVCTQPRRVAVKSVAVRVAQERGVSVGQEVGYSIRFENCTSRNTVLKFTTDGALLSEAMTDHLLLEYSVIVIDDVHLRTVSTDILLGIFKDIVQKRDDVKIILMSATMEVKTFEQYFNRPAVIEVSGRNFDVQVHYADFTPSDYVHEAAEKALQIHTTECDGDVLIFLTGEEEVERCCNLISHHVGHQNTVLPLYSSLPFEKQQNVFRPAYGRKFICATNIAETSLTIDGVVFVIDSGYSKQKFFDPESSAEAIAVQKISKASSEQRRGRAGRTRPGKVFRLYTRTEYNCFLQADIPELHRTCLTRVVLTLLQLGVRDLVHFDFMDPPAPVSLKCALGTLVILGAISEDGEINDCGKMLAEFGLAPEICVALVKSPKYDCSQEVLTIAAMLSTGYNCFRYVKNNRSCEEKHSLFKHGDGDHMTLLNAFEKYKESLLIDDRGWCRDNYVNPNAMRNADKMRTVLSRVMFRLGLKLLSIPNNDPERANKIGQALLEGFFMQVAMKTGNGEYLTVQNTPAVLDWDCSLSNNSQWVIFNEGTGTTTKKYIKTCSRIKERWLIDIAPSYYRPYHFEDFRMRNALLYLQIKYGSPEDVKDITKNLKRKRMI